MTDLGKISWTLGVDMAAFNKGIATASTKIEGISGKMKSAGAKMSGVGKGLTMGVSVPLIGIGAAAIFSADTFEKAYATIRAGTGATGADLDGLKADFDELAGTVPAGIGDIGTAIADLNTRLGLSGKPLQDMARQFLDLSRVTGTDVSGNISSLTRVFGDWDVAAQDQSGSLDHLFKTSQNTGIGINKLGTLMVQYGAPMRQLGFDFETSAVMMGKFEKEGVNTELVMGSLRIALGQMAREGITDASAALQEVTARIKNAGSASEANAIALEMFGARAGPDMAAAIREGRFEIDELMQAVQQSPETIAAAGEATQTFSERLDMMKTRVMEAAAPLGEKLIKVFERLEPMIIKSVDAVGGIIDKFSNLPQPLQDAIFILVGVAAAIGPILLVLGPVISLVGTLTPLLPVLAGAFAVMTGPIGLVVLAVAGLILAGKLLYDNWDKISAALGKVWEALAGAAKWVFDNIVQNLFPPVKVGLWLLENWDKIAKALGGVWEGLSDTAGAAWGGLVDLIKGYLNSLIGLLNGFIGFWNMIKFEVPSVDLPGVGRVGGFSVGVPQIPAIPKLAEGGIVTRPTLAVLGEAGPEAVVPLGRGGVGSLNVTIQGVDVDVVAARVVRIIRRELGVK